VTYQSIFYQWTPSPESGQYCCRVTNDATCSAVLSLAIQNTTEISKHNRTHNIRRIKTDSAINICDLYNQKIKKKLLAIKTQKQIQK